MLELINVSKRYGDTTVLHPTQLSVAHGESLLLIGPSGCGKSTTLRLLLGLLLPDSGEVRFAGELISSPQASPKFRERTGYVIQDGGLFPHLNAADNVCLKAQQLGWSKDRMKQRLTDLADLTHLPKALLTQYPAQLSGGQRQRVAIMRALMLDPDVLFLDEPLGALDPLIRAELQRDLKAIFASLGKTVVMVTHDMAEAEHFADRIVLMQAGRIVQQGRYEQFVSNPRNDFVAEFLQAQAR